MQKGLHTTHTLTITPNKLCALRVEACKVYYVLVCIFHRYDAIKCGQTRGVSGQNAAHRRSTAHQTRQAKHCNCARQDQESYALRSSEYSYTYTVKPVLFCTYPYLLYPALRCAAAKLPTLVRGQLHICSHPARPSQHPHEVPHEVQVPTTRPSACVHGP